MKIETILDAMEEAQKRYWLYPTSHKAKARIRQGLAFRDLILRTVAIYRNFAEANGYREDQAWFWTDEWQAGEKEVDCLIAKGEIHSFDTMDEFLETLEVDND